MDYPYTPIPNWFFPLVKHLNFSENKIMLCVWYNTVGYPGEKKGTRRDVSTLTYDVIQNFTGINNRQSIFRALKKLEALKLITRNPKRIYGQSIQVYPANPILPIEVSILDESGVTISDSGVTECDSRSHIQGTEKVQKVTHNKKTPKNQNQESTTTEKLTPAQAESLQLLLLNGLSETISRQLIQDAWNRGRDSDYITRSVGYGIQNAKTNLQGFIRNHIQRDFDVIPTSNGAGGPKAAKQGLNLSKYEHGGKDHFIAESTCVICHPELLQEASHEEI